MLLTNSNSGGGEDGPSPAPCDDSSAIHGRVDRRRERRSPLASHVHRTTHIRGYSHAVTPIHQHQRQPQSQTTSESAVDAVVGRKETNAHNAASFNGDNGMTATTRSRLRPSDNTGRIKPRLAPTSISSAAKKHLSLQQEYNVDHSCSTPLERLVRDIGNTLRQWHLHDGCVRHVPLDWAERMAWSQRQENQLECKGSDSGRETRHEHEKTAVGDAPKRRGREDGASPRMSMDLCERRFACRSRGIGRRLNSLFEDSYAENYLPIESLPLPKHNPPPTRPDCSERTRCIRSKSISFHTTGYTPSVEESENSSSRVASDALKWDRRSYDIPLVLQLWDAPPHAEYPSSFSTLTELDQNSTENDIARQSPDIIGPLSNKLHVPTNMLPRGLACNLSSLFNVGQHITLCLDLDDEEINSSNKNDVESVEEDMHAYMENQVHKAMEKSAAVCKQRRERQRCRPKKQKQQQCTPKRMTVNDSFQSMSDDTAEVDKGEKELIHDDHHSYSEYEDSSSNESSYGSDDTSYQDNSSLDLDQQEIHASLTLILQTALNLAASENDCRIPVFGIWGCYQGCRGDVQGEDAGGTPSWIPSIVDDFRFDQGGASSDSKRMLLSSPVISGTCQGQPLNFHASHRLYFIPSQVLPLHLSTLNGLSKVLLAQCPCPQKNPNNNSGDSSTSVVLAKARHFYHWKQPQQNENHTRHEKQDWRNIEATNYWNDEKRHVVEKYREQCRKQALLVLERASSPWAYGSTPPIWGPSEGNPLLSLSASVSWGSTSLEGNSSQPPLLRLPIKIRSSTFDTASLSELLDVENTIQSATLNPIGIGIGYHHNRPDEPIFLASSNFDKDAPCATLSANTRCVLAALIRCGSLANNTLPGHLSNKDILMKLSSPGLNGQQVPEKILQKVGPVTRHLIDALDWSDAVSQLSDLSSSCADFDRAIADTLQRVQSTTYPAPPVEVFSNVGIYDDGANTRFHTVSSDNICDERHQFQRNKGAPIGRLLSILFSHMARLRTPPSMMRLWLLFVEELRRRWERNESLPNLGFVPGLDTVETIDEEDGAERQPQWSLHKTGTCVLGHRADHTAFVNSSEQDVDRNHCIINQKLQVYTSFII